MAGGLRGAEPAGTRGCQEPTQAGSYRPFIDSALTLRTVGIHPKVYAGS